MTIAGCWVAALSATLIAACSAPNPAYQGRIGVGSHDADPGAVGTQDAAAPAADQRTPAPPPDSAPPDPAPPPDTAPPPAPQVNGLRGEYFDNVDFTGPRLTRVDGTIDFEWRERSPAPGVGDETFSVRWTGYLEPRFTETYTLYTTTDDGVRVWIDGQLIVDDWNDHVPTERIARVALTANRKHELRIEYYERADWAVARLEWSSASQRREVIPTSRLFSTP